jgi:hypothetical protein
VEQTIEDQGRTQLQALQYETQDLTKVWELTLEKSMGQKRKGTKLI